MEKKSHHKTAYHAQFSQTFGALSPQSYQRTK